MRILLPNFVLSHGSYSIAVLCRDFLGECFIVAVVVFLRLGLMQKQIVILAKCLVTTVV